jgi:hypothetical protein
MAGEHHKAPEAPRSSSEGKKESRESESQDVDLGVDVDASGVLEGVEGSEDGEAMGNVSESAEGLGEHRQATGGKFQKFQKKMTDDEAKALKAKLLTKPPTKRQMVQQVRKHIHDEIVSMEKQARKHRRAGSFQDLSRAVARIRELRSVLAQLFHATSEVVKNIWLRVVHGIV